MKKAKKLLAAALCGCMILLAGCGKTQSGAPAAGQSQAGADGQGNASPVLARPDHNLITGEEAQGAQSVRPVAVTVNILPKGNPQWGISGAKAVVEVLSEGKVPSMMCLFDGLGELPAVGPVGPARDVPLQLALPSDAVLMHIGANAYSYHLLEQYQYPNLDGYHVGVSCYDLDHDRDQQGYPNEFCWYTKNELLRSGMEQHGLPASTDHAASLLEFGDGAAVPARAPSAGQLLLTFAEGWQVQLNYADGVYRKTMGNGEPHIDAANGEQLAFEYVIVLFCPAGVKDDGYTRNYALTQGTGVYLTKGAYLPIQWQKGRPDQPLRLFDLEGKPIQVTPGRSYIGIYGGFSGQSIQVLNGEGELTLPPVPEALPAPPPPPEPTPRPEEPAPAEGGEPAPEEGGEPAPAEGGEPAPEG